MNKKIKINLVILKWLLTCSILLGNLLLLARNDDKIFIIVYEIIINCLAVGIFILLTIFPKLYYIFDEGGISYQNGKGKELIYICWDEAVSISYVYVMGFIRDGLEIKWKDGSDVRKITLIISPKQAKEVYDLIPKVKEIIDKSN